MRFCSDCGKTVEVRVPQGDTLPRFVCSSCGTIHYQNPKLVVGAIAEHQGKILLCRRAIEPRRSFWTLPAGFMENGETAEQAALRETMEEAHATIELDGLFSLISVPRIGQVHLFYRGHLPKPEFAAGTESLEVALFDEADLPWDELAFPTVGYTLRWYLADRRAGRFQLHTQDITAMLPREPRQWVPA